jgi:hypothetical protein
MAQRKIVRKTVELAEENVNWFYETYESVGGKPSLSWVLDLMLEEFKKAHTHTPTELAVIGAAELKRLLETR